MKKNMSMFSRSLSSRACLAISVIMSSVASSLAAVPLPPLLDSPGLSSSPGTAITDDTPTFRWSASSGATGYGLYIRDLTTGILVYDNDYVANVTSLTLPSGLMVAGHQYRWNMRAQNATDWSSFSSYLYFQMQGSLLLPSISSISPNPVPALSANQNITIRGVNFQSGCTLNFIDTSGVNFASVASKLTFNSSSQLTYQFNNASDVGTWKVKVNNPGGISSSLFSFTVIAQASSDAYEPDNSMSAAKMIANGQVQRHSIHAARDTDWAKFRVGGPGARNLQLETDGTSGDTQLWLYNATGTRIAYDDDSGTDSFSRITLAALAPGTYYIRIRECGNNGTIQAYTLRARWTAATTIIDAYEPDDLKAVAKAIANGQTQRRSIHMAGNTDWAKVVIGRPGARNVCLETSGSSGDTQIWLYNAAGTRIAYNDNTGVGRFSRITRSSLARGTYFIRIREYGNNGTIPAYRLKASWTAR